MLLGMSRLELILKTAIPAAALSVLVGMLHLVCSDTRHRLLICVSHHYGLQWSLGDRKDSDLVISTGGAVA
jgi:hypothetical protein